MDGTNEPLLAQRSPITLAFLFYLVTFGAIISACLRTLTQDGSLTTESLGALIASGAALGAAIGTVLGIFLYRSFSVAGIAFLCGLFVGAIAGALALIGSQRFLEISTIACMSSWLVIVAMALAARYRQVPHY